MKNKLSNLLKILLFSLTVFLFPVESYAANGYSSIDEAFAEYESLGYTRINSNDEYIQDISNQVSNGITSAVYYCDGSTYSTITNFLPDFSDVVLNNAVSSKSYNCSTRTYSNGTTSFSTYVITFSVELRCTAAEIAAAKQAAASIVSMYNSGSTYDKIKNVHDYLCNTITYDQSLSIHTVYGALVGHCCVCDGYAYSFKYIMDLMGIPCKVREGTIDNSGSHAWNNVQIDGQWYHIDATWDDQVTYIWRDYFLVGQDKISDSSLALTSYVPGGSTTTPTAAATQAVTQTPTEAPTQATTQAPTQTPTEAPTQAATEAVTEATTEAETETTTEEDTTAATTTEVTTEETTAEETTEAVVERQTTHITTTESTDDELLVVKPVANNSHVAVILIVSGCALTAAAGVIIFFLKKK